MFNRPSSAPYGQPPMTAAMVSSFATTYGQHPVTHRDPRLGIPKSNDGSFEREREEHQQQQQQQTSGRRSATQQLLPHQQYAHEHHNRRSQSSWSHEEEDEGDEEDDRVEPASHNPPFSHRQTTNEDEHGADEESHDETGHMRHQHRDDDDANEDEHDPEEHVHEEAAEDVDETDQAHDTDRESPTSRPPRSDRVRVAVRCRPLLPSEQQASLGRIGGGSCVQIEGNDVLLAKSRLFTFDHAFGPVHSQEQVYKAVGTAMVKAAFEGYHSTIMAVSGFCAESEKRFCRHVVFGSITHSYALSPLCVLLLIALVWVS